MKKITLTKNEEIKFGSLNEIETELQINKEWKEDGRPFVLICIAITLGITALIHFFLNK